LPLGSPFPITPLILPSLRICTSPHFRLCVTTVEYLLVIGSLLDVPRSISFRSFGFDFHTLFTGSIFAVSSFLYARDSANCSIAHGKQSLSRPLESSIYRLISSRWYISGRNRNTHTSSVNRGIRSLITLPRRVDHCDLSTDQSRSTATQILPPSLDFTMAHSIHTMNLVSRQCVSCDSDPVCNCKANEQCILTSR
jgi:hypothetical protein